jgi:hypothetical protein
VPSAQVGPLTLLFRPGLKELGDRADMTPVNRRLADKHLAEVHRRRTDRFQDRDLLDLFRLLGETEDRLRNHRRSEPDDDAGLDWLMADLDEVRVEIEARGICPYHQAALNVCCFR